jgi:hypothetical protein
MIDLDYLLLSLKTDRDVPVGPSRVSNFLSQEYNRYFPKNRPAKGPDDSGNGSNPSAYFYPRLQYKIVRGSPMIAAVNEGCDLLWRLYEQLDEVSETQAEWQITEKRLIDKKAIFGLVQGFIKYRFLTPWLALPEEGFKKYLLMDNEAREIMLARILEGHIRSVSSSLGYEISDEIKIRINPKPDYIFQRDIHVAGLFGSFITNFEIPNFLGLGKSVSRGFGTIKQV